MAKIKFTKTALKKQRDALKQFKRFLPTLQLKKQQLQMEIRLSQKRLQDNEAKEAQVKADLDSWVSMFATPGAVDLLASLVLVDGIDTGRRNIAGIDVPVFDKVRFQTVEYDLFSSEPWIDNAVAMVKDIIAVRVEHEIIQEQFRLLSQELRTTTQRVNLFEKVKIPECKSIIKKIQIYMGRYGYRRGSPVQDRQKENSGGSGMIVPMIEASIVCLDSERARTMTLLGELGLLHVKLAGVPPASNARQVLEQQLATVDQACDTLKSYAGPQSAAEFCGTVAELVSQVTEQDTIRAESNAQYDALQRQRKVFEPWGDFQPETLANLRQNGLHIYFCQGNQKQYEDASAGTNTVELISEDKGKFYFVVIATTPAEPGSLPVTALPEDNSLGMIDRACAQLHERRTQAETTLTTLATALPLLLERREKLHEQLEFQTNCEGMSQSGELAYIDGFVPQTELGKLQAAARQNGWALEYEPADSDDHAVPTLVIIPKFARVIEPMIKFLGISPGYNETDVSASILFFLTIFFGIIVGDAGYGMLFLAVVAVAWFKFTDPKIRLALKLVIVFSLSTVVWGGLCGAWFGIESPNRPAFFKGIEWLTNEHTKDAHVQLICFSLAITHLTIGRLWRAALRLNSPRWIITHLGWICILWGNFFVALKLLVIPGPFPMYIPVLYITGAALVMIFGIHWHELGEIFDFPFGVIGSFVDILSYIRLFAVGMSGAYIASSFNDMAGGLFHQSSPLMTVLCSILAIVILLGGHGINLALAGMGVLVHGVRLNVLEFSNHVGLSWSGHAYRPFRCSADVQSPADAGAINQVSKNTLSK